MLLLSLQQLDRRTLLAYTTQASERDTQYLMA